MELKMDFGGSTFNKKGLDASLLYDLLVIGSGPAGLNAALYAKRKGMNVAMISNKMGGQVMDTSVVENYLGIQDESGEGLVKKFTEHVNTLDIPTLKNAQVNRIEKGEDRIISVSLSDGRLFKSKTLILATGSNPRKLGVEGEEEYLGRGVAYCAICDGPLFEGRDVVVAGGGNSAIEAAIDLSKMAKTVKVVHRSQLRADQIVIDKLKQTNNVEIFLEHQILSVQGEMLVSGIKVLDKNAGEEKVMPTDGLFVEIGYLPNNSLAKGLVALNKHGEIIVNAKNETNVPGIYAAGDVTDVPYKQIVISAGEGAKAALTANDYVNRW